MDSQINIPILEEHYFSIMSCEVDTGIILCTNGKRYTGTGNLFWLCNDWDVAYLFVNEQIKINPKLEFSIYNHKAEMVYWQNVYKSKFL